MLGPKDSCRSCSQPLALMSARLGSVLRSTRLPSSLRAGVHQASLSSKAGPTLVGQPKRSAVVVPSPAALGARRHASTEDNGDVQVSSPLPKSRCRWISAVAWCASVDRCEGRRREGWTLRSGWMSKFITAHPIRLESY